MSLPSSSRTWLAIFSISAGTFLLVCSELAPVALLPDIAASWGTQVGNLAWLVSCPAILAAVSAPMMATLAGRLGPRAVMLISVALLSAPMR